jgi:hypothetical protein
MKPHSILLLIVAVAGGTALYKGGQRVAPYNAPLASGDSVQYSAFGRVRQGVGSVGSMMVKGWVRSLVDTSEKDLEDMKTSLQKKRGIVGDKARKSAKTAMVLDSTALDELVHAHPFAAVSHATKARDYLTVARRLLAEP